MRVRVVAGAMLAACAAFLTVPVASGAAASKPAVIKIAVVGPFGNTFFAAEVDGLKAAAAKVAGQKVELTEFNSNFDTSLEYSQVATLATTKTYQGVALAALDGTGIVPAVEQDIKAGIKVVNINNELGPNQTCAQQPQLPGQTGFVGDPPCARGPLMAKLIVDACGSEPDCQVGYIAGDLALPIEQALIAGIKSYLKSYSHIHLVTVQNGGQYLAGPSITVTKNILTGHPDVTVIAAGGDQEIAGAAVAVDQLGLKDKVKLIGYGASTIAVAALRACTKPWYGTVAMLPMNEGELAMGLLVKAIDGAPVHVGESAVAVAEAQHHFNPLITCADAKSFTAQWQG
ncbi:MAG TPA: sugar ABC transporter substrate-binding protein [Acidimicrobiales bacterium]|nr:sugar ABC transporter substrate-binding protein [Acidimicrobiales bacterium]